MFFGLAIVDSLIALFALHATKRAIGPVSLVLISDKASRRPIRTLTNLAGLTVALPSGYPL